MAVIHEVQDDEGKGEEAKLHLGGRAGQRRLSESGNWRAHRRTGASAARGWEGAEGGSPGARGQRWSVPRGQHLPALTLRDQEEKRTGWGVESPQGGSRPCARPSFRRGGRGSELLARRWPRSSLSRRAQPPLMGAGGDYHQSISNLRGAGGSDPGRGRVQLSLERPAPQRHRVPRWDTQAPWSRGSPAVGTYVSGGAGA